MATETCRIQRFRIEHDSMGELQVPADALWGAQTQRAVQNFPISGLRMPREFIRALGLIKAAAAEVNGGLGPAGEGAAPRRSARRRWRSREGEHDAQFPIDVFQTGSGTSSNMNANEVIATLATRAGEGARSTQRPRQPRPEFQRRDPDRDPGLARSSPCVEQLLPALKHLRRTIERARRALGKVTKTGRTHLMDAMPLTFGQEFGAWAAQLASARGADRGRAEAPAPPADRRHRDRHRHQCRSALRQGRWPRRCRRCPGTKLRVGRRQVRGHRRAGRRGRAVRPAQRAGGGADEDRQRPALDEFRAAGRAGRDRAAGVAAGQLDHAGQGQPGDPGGDVRWSARR